MKWTIYDKAGKVKHESLTNYDGNGNEVCQDKLEYSGKWMGESYLAVSIKTAYPIDFQIGDYIEYRGEKFCINYDPTVIKKSRRGTYGEGFVYDNIKFNSYSNELTMMRFHDWVLSDNELHYSSLPTFSFYAKDVDDLVDRLQACANRWCKANSFDQSDYWMFYTLANNTSGTDDSGQIQTTYERTVQRAMDISTDASFTGTVKAEWIKTYGTGADYADSRDDERYDRNISISGNSVWEGLQKVKTEFGLNFIIRGRNVYVGTAGIPTSHLFKYGKGNGLYEIDKAADSSQNVVTRLHAYGSDENLPTRYYAELGVKIFATIANVYNSSNESACSDYKPGSADYIACFDIKMSYKYDEFTTDTYYDWVGQKLSNPTGKIVKFHLEGSSDIVTGVIAVGDGVKYGPSDDVINAGKCQVIVRYNAPDATQQTDWQESDQSKFKTFSAALLNGKKIIFDNGVKSDAVSSENKDYQTANMPDNMAVNSLMLPGFPNYALSDICRSSYDSGKDVTNYYITNPETAKEVLFHSESGKHLITYSNDRHDPYIVSQNASEIGYRDGDISCTESNDDNGLEAVYPTIEEITAADAGISSSTARLDAVVGADTIDDNGVFDKDNTSISGFHITLPELGFDLRQAAKDAGGSEMKISMKDGFCGGRTFSVTNCTQQTDGTWKIACKRSQDTSLDLWFPYSYAKSVQTPGASMANAYQILAGDHYVLTGIAVSSVNYIWAASVRLLRKAIHWLCKNDYTRYVFTPKIDEIFMARQSEEAKADKTETIKSLHDTIKEGDLLLFADSDLMLNGSVYIDQLSIKENGNKGIPTYEVTLRDEVNVGTIQRIQNKVDSISNDIRNGNIGNGGVSALQVEPLIQAYGKKYFLSKLSDDTAQGLITFAKGLVSEMAAKLKGGATFGNGYEFDKDGNVVVNALNSLTFDEALERGFGFTKNASTGKYTLSVTDLMVWGKAVFNSLEIRKLYAVGGNVYLSGASSKIQHVVAVTDTDGNVTGWKCYILNDDGTTATQNGWVKYDQAKCQTFDIAEGVYENVSNTYYWRLVTDVSTENEAITETVTETGTDEEGNETTTETTVELYDGKKFGWIILSKSDCESSTNDEPKAGDTIVLDGHRMFATGDTEGRDQYNDESRTNVMMLETTGTDTGSLPRIVALTGITDYKHSEASNQYSNTVFILSPKEVVFVSSAIKWISATGDPITFVNFRGAWTEGTSYAYYDQVSHDNAIWTCIAEKGTTTTLEPTDANSAVWRKEISGGKGEKGDDAVTYELVASPGYIKLDADGSIDYSNGYTDPQKGTSDGNNREYLVVRGYKVVNGIKDNKFATDEKPITCRLSFNGGDAYFEYTATTNDEVDVDFDPIYDEASLGSLPDEISKNRLKNASVIMYEGEEYSSDKILATLDIPIVKDGADGTSYNVSLTVEKRTVSSVTEDSLVVTFSKSGADGVTTTENVQAIGGYAQVYVDGTLNDAMTSKLNNNSSDAGELMQSQYPAAFSASYVTVKWYDKEGGTLLGMGSLTRGADGEAAVTYEVQVSSYSEYVGSGRIYGLQFQFVKVTGATRQTVTDVREIGCVIAINTAAYIYTDAASYINEGRSHFLFSSYPVANVTMDEADNITVKMYLSTDTEKENPVAVANFANGKQGADGMGALEISVSPDTVIFDTDDNGLVSSSASKTATISCYRDGKKVENVEYALPSSGHPDCNATISTANSIATVTISGIATDATYGVSKTSGTVKVQVYDVDNGRYYYPTVKFAVNVAKFNGSMVANNKKFETVYNELTNNGSSTDLTWYESKIEQTARNISLKVQEKNVGRRNLLVGSAFRKQESGFCNIIGGYISINGGYEGTNCVRAVNQYSGTQHYYGVFWDGSQGGSSVKIERGKKYILSVWVKCDNVNATIALEPIFTDKQTSATRTSARPKQTKQYFKVTNANEWELLQSVIDTSLNQDGSTNTLYDCLAVNVWCSHALSGVTVNAWFSRPMLEEGEEYNGWTQSEQDYDYVGGNLLDNTGTLTESGNLATVNGTVTEGGMGESASIKRTLPTTASEIDPLAFSTSGMGIKAGEDYILSFYAKADSDTTAGKLQCFFHPSSGGIYTEDSAGGNDNSRNPSDGNLLYGIVPTTAWKRYWVHWRPTASDMQYVRFRVYSRGTSKGSYSSTTTYAVDDYVLYNGTYWRCKAATKGNAPTSSSSYWEATVYDVSIAQPKLEVGATITEWTEKRADMVDKQALLATGIDIDNKIVTVTADKFRVQNNSGEQTALVTGDGKLTTSLIDANTVVAQGIKTQELEAQNLKVTGSSKFGIWSIGTDSKWGDVIQASDFTDLNGVTYVGSMMQYTPSFVRGGSSAGAYMRVGPYTAEFGQVVDNGYNGIWFGYAARIVCQGSTNSWDLPTGYVYNTGYSPTAYIYSKGSGENPAFAINRANGGAAIRTNGAVRCRGFGGGVTTVSSSTTLDNNAYFVRCTNSSGITVTLPSDPVEGQTVIIVQAGGSVSISGGSKTIWARGKTGGTSSVTSGMTGQFNIFVYDGTRWNATMMNGTY